jgi:hypothetical protein
MARNFTALFTTIASSIPKLSIAALLLTSIVNPGLAAAIKSAAVDNSPNVAEDKITIRIRVKDTEGRNIINLSDQSFKLQVDDKEVPFKSKDWKGPQDTAPPPNWIIVLLDMSGSMGKPDSKGTTKLKGALTAITQFKTTISDRMANFQGGAMPQIAIVPFGKPGPGCAGFPVGPDELEKFFPANDFKLQNHLDFLAAQVPCASTNLYEPLSKSIRFLGNEKDARFYIPKDSTQPKPRLSIILLSDGYHTEPREAEEFESLKTLMRQNPDTTIHTLGYGLTLAELGKKYGLGRPATRQDITWSNLAPKAVSPSPTPSQTPTTKEAPVKGKVSADEFVDQERLQEIAQLTGGVSEFSGDAAAVASKLQVFLNALLSEYEISYIQPNADRGSKHSVKAVVNADSKSVESNTQSYTIPVFGRTLPFGVRSGMFLFTLMIMGSAGVIPFRIWANKIKQEGA